tara:strand:- start:678 stop:917 length:240 start_codon:yes stop_codon:yes gene_type:complete
MGKLHEEAFQEIDCLSCANCCKTTGPLFIPSNIKRISKRFKMRPTVIETQYLHIDEGGDKVLHQLPCPFLGIDNYWGIY